MSRFADTLMKPGSGPQLGILNQSLNLAYGGMNGLSPDFTQWISTQAYVQKNLISFVIEYPKAFDLLPDADKRAWIIAYKALIELHCQSWTGFQGGYELEVIENAVGGSGQMMEDFTKATEARTQPQGEWPEKYNMSIANFWRTFVRTFMINPQTGYPDIMTMTGITRPTDHLADLYAGTVLFVEPDATMLNPVQAYLVANFWPKSTGEITAKRDLTQAAEQKMVSIQFAALTQQGQGVNNLAREVLQSVQISGANPWNRPAFVSQIDAAVQAAAAGYKANVEQLGAQAVRF